MNLKFMSYKLLRPMGDVWLNADTHTHTHTHTHTGKSNCKPEPEFGDRTYDVIAEILYTTLLSWVFFVQKIVFIKQPSLAGS